LSRHATPGGSEVPVPPPVAALNEIAELYDQVRPGYPEALFDRIQAVSAIPAGATVLEVGCGTGQATVPLLDRGFAVVAVEPGPRLAALARARCGPAPRFRVEVERFEDWRWDGPPFPLIVSGGAFHWVEPTAGFTNAARWLASDGWLALFWHMPADPEGPDQVALAAAYRAHAPELGPQPGLASLGRRIQSRADWIDRSGPFELVETDRFAWSGRYDAEAYLRLMETRPGHRRLTAGVRAALDEAVGRAIRARGGRVELQFESVLFLARKRWEDPAAGPAVLPPVR
jgi:SAM-dependent methyltransferase